MSKDLKNFVPKVVVDNQKPDKGNRYFLSINGILHEYFHDDDLFIVDRLVKKIKAEIGWFERISTHAPSVGSFYESIVQSTIQEVLPADLKLGTGFIYDSERRDVSPQIDLIVYTDKIGAVLYKRSDFVVVDSANVISCIEVKKTLTKAVLKQIILKYANSNLGTSPLAVRGIQFLNVFSFYSKISLPKIYNYAKETVLSILHLFESETVDNNKVHFDIRHLVLPRLYFFDRAGYISFHCSPFDEQTIKIDMSLNNSSIDSHSLGEFLVSVTSLRKGEQNFSKRNFLTYPLVINESSETIYNNLNLWRKFPMDELLDLFPEAAIYLEKVRNNDVRPYAALISSSIEDLSKYSISSLEKSKGFRWLSIDKKHFSPK